VVKALNCGFVGLLRKARVLLLWFAFFLPLKSFANTKSRNKSLQHHSGASRLRWTVFKSQFYGFAAQKYSIKPQLKNCR